MSEVCTDPGCQDTRGKTFKMQKPSHPVSSHHSRNPLLRLVRAAPRTHPRVSTAVNCERVRCSSLTLVSKVRDPRPLQQAPFLQTIGANSHGFFTTYHWSMFLATVCGFLFKAEIGNENTGRKNF